MNPSQQFELMRQRKTGAPSHLGTEAVAQAAELLDAVVVLERLDGGQDDGVDVFLGVGVVAGSALGQPAHKVKAVTDGVEGEGVAVEDVDDEGDVAVGGELIGHQLAVLPDANDIGDVEQADALVLLVGGRGGQVAVPLAGDLDGLAGGGAPVPGGQRCRVGGDRA